jgi:hypothetical protein
MSSLSILVNGDFYKNVRKVELKGEDRIDIPLRKLHTGFPARPKPSLPGPCRTPTDELNMFQKVDLKDSAGAEVYSRGYSSLKELVRTCTMAFSGQQPVYHIQT